MAMEVLVTGGDSELGHAVAEAFCAAGHHVTLTGADRERLQQIAQRLDVDAIACDTADPASLAEARTLFPHHLDALVNVPVARTELGDPRTFTVAEVAEAWRGTLDATVLSAVLTVQTIGDHLRSGGSIINLVGEAASDGGVDAAMKAALGNWTAGQATVFGTRGITVNVVACGESFRPGYDGLTRTPPPVAAEIARLAVFLTTPAARHITGQTLHVSHGALAQFGS
ncbi:SDR family oxidoreductase [Mycolicibacillus parakoreensis]|uniref:SDR family oxidoreductase n=1 Tax=Mycolicibacillus parakoreensis TaxID=1069221 RepID=A0ABY3U9Z5_9MYCO|nr:SDR family oxidoreductase [Mycolicibacillus parakoreensis]MCV7317539.1 SDR family oxidoreductase [Mycolicibacillus parakoreensis]ULN54250.1 SDR family oxidoreductase [Mycolicibacillus parakoreensis]